MVVSESTYLGDTLFYIKNDLLANVTDPISATRATNSKFVMTSYPQRLAQYPLITIRSINQEFARAGMFTSQMNLHMQLEIRIWARDQKEKDTLTQSVINRLRNIQYTASTGSIANQLHFFRVLNTVDVDEDGTNTPKSRLITIEYSFYSFT